MKQFILSTEPDKENIIRLKGDDFHYLVNVRRAAEGDTFPAVLPDGEEAFFQILSVKNGVLTCKRSISPDAASPSEKFPPIILFQALAKGGRMDLIVRQAAETGITEIVPFVSEFSVAKTGQGGQKFLRWERIIKEARQQSGSKIATAIRRPFTMNEIFEYWKNLNKTKAALGILFHHTEIDHESLHNYLDIIPETMVLAVGPEGGFSGKEVSLFLQNGFKSMKIGDTILRTETAALFCTAAVKILLLERNSWELKQAKKNSV